ncbi:hypothetical protein E2C01_101799 [Portunus trituberculatus]|uniref:Uncharacterized protein n=1 Tax=Portunus trituberculatus TaxID=210409 RepID=A0A5B7KFR3_PORTR|nr:hypothetical protein [Portunus trituberculatus]
MWQRKKGSHMDGLLDNDQSAQREEEGKEGTVLTSSSPPPASRRGLGRQQRGTFSPPSESLSPFNRPK